MTVRKVVTCIAPQLYFTVTPIANKLPEFSIGGLILSGIEGRHLVHTTAVLIVPRIQ